jgi:hypothetical protein
MFQQRGLSSVGFRMFQLFTSSFRLASQQQTPYRQNGPVVEHKGLLRVLGLIEA